MTTIDPKSVTDANLDASQINVQNVPLDKKTVEAVANRVNTTKIQDPVVDCGDSNQLNLGEWSGSGFQLKTPSKTPNQAPTKGTMSPISPLARGQICGTGTGIANLNLEFSCNFVTGVNLDTCAFKFQKKLEAYIEMAQKWAMDLISSLFPGVSYFQKLADSICAWANEVQKIICFIQQVLACVIGTITQMLSLVTWVMSLPARYLQMLISCVTGFFSSIAGSLLSVTSALKFVFTLLNCQIEQCPSVDNIFDIVTPDANSFATATTDLGNAVVGDLK